MRNYFAFFPEKSLTELRNVTFLEEGVGATRIPQGRFHFVECFCTEKGCDCQRVLVQVMRQDHDLDAPTEVATISYTWNTNNKDRTWQVARELPNPMLDPLHRQEPYAADMMSYWAHMVAKDREYLERIKRHYRELREAFGIRAKPERLLQPVLNERQRRDRQRQLEQIKRQRKAR